jgi:ABC-2 type transport system permease protein
MGRMTAAPAVCEPALIRLPPSFAATWRALLRADFTVQWRQRRSLVLTVLVPIAFLIGWKDLIPTIGAHGVLAICIAVGLPAMGLMGYSQTIARDREKGVFQRLRTTPTATSAIMGSRILVQLAITMAMTLCTYATANAVDGITLGAGSVALVLVAALAGGMAFLALGQCVVALVRSAEAVSAVGRLIYLPLALVGGLGAAGLLGPVIQRVVVWSPIGTTKTLLLAAMSPTTIDLHAVAALAVTLGYGVVFAAIGIRWFKWSID